MSNEKQTNAQPTNTPNEPNAPPILAQFAGSLTGMAGGTVIRPEDQNYLDRLKGKIPPE